MEKTMVDLKKKITPEWKEFLRKYTSSKDVAKISADGEVGFYLLERIRQGAVNISNEKNKKCLEELVSIALENAKALVLEAEQDCRLMQETLSSFIESD